MAFKLLLLCAILVACVSSQSYHFEKGNKVPGDIRLHFEIPHKSAQIFQVVTKDITWPRPGVKNATVTYIRALDQYTNYDGGYVSITGGGINQQYVTLHFESQVSRGFKFILEIWGH